MSQKINNKNPRFPIYIPSKGRYDTCLTVKAFERMGVPYYVIVEQQEYKKYIEVIDKKKVLILPKKYQDDYDTFDDLGYKKSKGAGAARNFAWQHSIDNKFKWHWVIDDNIVKFYRLNKNLKVPVSDGTIFRCMEDFVLRYENIAMAGPHYDYFIPRKQKSKPFILNTRVFSCNLIRNDIKFRWRGRYNEDADLSIRILKAGWCTIQFFAFLQGKVPTQVMKGGNTVIYKDLGTYPKSIMLVNMHPDITRLVKRYGRWHHVTDYSVFKKNKLIRKKDIKIDNKIDNYGMVFKDIDDNKIEDK